MTTQEQLSSILNTNNNTTDDNDDDESNWRFDVMLMCVATLINCVELQVQTNNFCSFC
jgi:hypothetical protein